MTLFQVSNTRGVCYMDLAMDTSNDTSPSVKHNLFQAKFNTF